MTDAITDAVAAVVLGAPTPREPFDGVFVHAPPRLAAADPVTLPRDHVYCSNVLSLAKQHERGKWLGPRCNTLIWLDDTDATCPYCGAAA